MADVDKVINGLKRCLVCNMSPIAPAECQKAYLECEYTIGLYCAHKKLIRDAITVLERMKGEQNDI